MATIEVLALDERNESGVGPSLDLGTPMVISVTLSCLHPQPKRARPHALHVELEHSHDNVNWRPLHRFAEHERLPTRGSHIDGSILPTMMHGDFLATVFCARYVRAKWTLEKASGDFGGVEKDKHNMLEFGVAGESGDAAP